MTILARALMVTHAGDESREAASVVLYAGENAFPLGDGRHLAVPLARRWEM